MGERTVRTDHDADRDRRNENVARFDKPAVAAVGDGEGARARPSEPSKDSLGWTGEVWRQVGTARGDSAGVDAGAARLGIVEAAADDELGFAYFVPQLHDSSYPTGRLQIVNRSVSTTRPAPTVSIGCGGAGFYDIAVEAVPASFDEQLKNAAYISRTGGTLQTARIQSSIDRFYEQSLQRSDLGLRNDTQVAQWASTIVQLYAYPQRRSIL